MGAILGMGFPQALVHTVHSTCACGKTHSQDCPHGEIRHCQFMKERNRFDVTFIIATFMGKVSPRKLALSSHEGEKSFKCNICDSTFS